MACNKTKAERVVVLVFAAIENFFHSSILFGWPSLVYVLKDLGYYRDLCPPSDDNATTTILTSITSNSTSPPTSFSTSITTERVDTVDENAVECDAQDARLLLIYTIASSLVPCSMLFSGILFERGGTLITRITFSISLFIAYLCIAASSPSVPDLLFPGTILMGVAGIFIIICGFEVSNLFPKYKSTTIGLLVGACDSSACVLLLIKVLYDAGISMNASFYALAVSTLLFTVNTVLLPRLHIPWPLPAGYRLDKGCCSKYKDTNSNSSHQNSENPTDVSTIEAYEIKENNNKYVNGDTNIVSLMSSGLYTNLDEKYSVNNQSDTGKTSLEKGAVWTVSGHEAEQTNGSILADDTIKDFEKKEGRVIFHDNAGYEHEQDGNFDDFSENKHQTACQEVNVNRVDIQLSKAARRATMDKLSEDQRLEDFPTTWSILKSPMFLLMTFWTVACQGEIFFVIGIMNPWLAWLADGDTEAVSFYTNIFAVTTIGSLFGSPIMGYVFDRRKLLSEKSSQKDNAKGPYADLQDSWLPVAISTCTAILMSGLMMIPILPVQFGTFILLTAVRAEFYSASAAIVPITFPMRYYPTVFGTANFIAGVCSLAQYPLFIVIQGSLDGDPRWVLAGFMIANVIALVYPLYIYVYGKKHEKHYLETRRRENTTPNGIAT